MIAFGSLIFWIALAVGLIVPAVALFHPAERTRDEEEPVWFVAVWLAALTAAAHFFVDDLPQPELSATAIAGGLLVYLVIGLGWAALRWREDMIEVRDALSARHGDVTRESILRRYGFRSDPPSPRDCPRRIGARIAYWPFLVLGEFTSLFAWLGQAFDFMFRAITKRVFEGAPV